MSGLDSGRGSPSRIATMIFLLAAAVPGRAQSCFEGESPATHLADVLVSSMGAADMDGDDGALDLLVANPDGDTVSVLLNQGAGSFSPSVDYATGDEPNSVAAADFDGDGLPDVVTADYRSSTLSVFMNRGQGRLAARIAHQIAAGPFFVTAADLNADGAPDLVAVDYSTFAVSVLLNLGDGTFGPEAISFVGPYPTSLTCADVDGDGDTDLVVLNYGWQFGVGSLTVLLNQGNGTFAAEPEIVLDHPGSLLSIVSGDFDGDGHVDLAIQVLNERSVLFLFNRGDGSFERPIAREVDWFPYSIWAADVDLDGRPDVVTLGDNYGVSVLRSLGNREFAPYVYSGTRGVQIGALADLDGDGKPDLATLADDAHSYSVLSVMLNAGAGRFAERGQIPVGGHPSCVTSADLDGDGASDLISTVQYPDAISVLRNRGDGSFEPGVAYAAGDLPTSVASADLDGDGSADLVVANGGSNSLSIFINRGDGTFRPQVQVPVGEHPNAVTCADLDGDGLPDLAVGNGTGGFVSVLLNRGGGRFGPALNYPLAVRAMAGPTVTAVDLDLDGHLDLAVSLLGGAAVLRNRGDGTFGSPEYYGGFNLGPMIAIGDVDGDGYPDLAVTASIYDDVQVSLNRRDGTFGAPQSYRTNSEPSGLIFVDFDGDGHPDIVALNPDLDSLSVLRNTGSGRFALEASYPTGRRPNFPTSVDLDGDGDDDLVVANSQEASLSILRNCRSAGIVFCSGDGSSTACPCGNSSAPGSGAGCLDSRGVSASLRAAGSARLAHDELVLAAADLPGGIAFYIQGATRENGGAGTVYGDGLLCAGGPLRPIGAAAIANGSASYPRPGDPSVSHRGLVLAPGTRTYQVLCRDRARFCTSDTFNLSNGIEIVWGP